MSRLPATHQLGAADAQPISPDETYVAELRRIFLLKSVISIFWITPLMCHFVHCTENVGRNAMNEATFPQPLFLTLQARFQAQQMAEKEEKMIAIMEQQGLNSTEFQLSKLFG